MGTVLYGCHGGCGGPQAAGIYVYGCGIEQENGFCVAGITVPSGVLFHRQLSLVLEQCRGPARKALGSLL